MMRTGRKLTVPSEDLVLLALGDGSYEVFQRAELLGYVRPYESTTEIKPGKVRASARRKPVKRWMATQVNARGRTIFGERTAREAAQALLRQVQRGM
jgi:hypothetical protein